MFTPRGGVLRGVSRRCASPRITTLTLVAVGLFAYAMYVGISQPDSENANIATNEYEEEADDDLRPNAMVEEPIGDLSDVDVGSYNEDSDKPIAAADGDDIGRGEGIRELSQDKIELDALRKSLSKLNLADKDDSANARVRRGLIEVLERPLYKEPAKPWLIAEKMAEEYTFLSLVVDIGKYSRRVLILVGCGSKNPANPSELLSPAWFEKHYPSFNSHPFDIHVIQPDPDAADRMDAFVLSRTAKGVRWPHTLTVHRLGVLEGARQQEGVRMFTIVDSESIGDEEESRHDPLSDLHAMEHSRQVSANGINLDAWIKTVVSEGDLCILAMDIGAAEHNLFGEISETTTEDRGIDRVTELFVESHYNRWLKSAPFRASVPFTFAQSATLIDLLRNEGVPTHQVIPGSGH